MKKLLVLLMFSFVAFLAVPAKAQTSLVSQYSLTTDTVTNTATKYLSLPSAVPGYYKSYSVQLWNTKISGTVGGTATLQYSHDGTNYYSTNDTVYTLSDASGAFGWNLTDWGARYIRVKVTGTGTMSTKINATAIFRKDQ